MKASGIFAVIVLLTIPLPYLMAHSNFKVSPIKDTVAISGTKNHKKLKLSINDTVTS